MCHQSQAPTEPAPLAAHCVETGAPDGSQARDSVHAFPVLRLIQGFPAAQAPPRPLLIALLEPRAGRPEGSLGRSVLRLDSGANVTCGRMVIEAWIGISSFNDVDTHGNTAVTMDYSLSICPKELYQRMRGT